MDRQQLYIDLYLHLNEKYIQQGLEEEQAQEKAYEIAEAIKELVESILETLEEDHWYCSIRKIIPINLLDKWWIKSRQEKINILYHLGMDIRLPWKESEGYYPDPRNHGKVTEGLFVVGSERTDKEWVLSGYASWEAELDFQERKHGGDHVYTLRRMGRQK